MSALAASGPAIPPVPGPPGPVLAGPGPAGPGPPPGPSGTAAPDAAGEWRPPFPLDVPRTLGVHRRGGGDPAFRVAADGSIWRTALTPEGPGTIRVTVARPAPGTDGQAVTVVRGAAWGPGASWLLSALPAALGAD